MKKLSLIIIYFCLLLFSCSNERVQADQSSEFIVLSMNILGSLENEYPPGDVELKVKRNPDGSETAIYKLVGESKENAEMGLFASRTGSDGGTDCDSALSCAKAAKKCLDDNKDALISNGSCATYCVKCQDPA